MQPAINDGVGRRFGSVDIALDHRRALDPKLTDLVGAKGIARIIDAFGFKRRHGAASTVGLADKKVARDRGDNAAGFGHAIAGIGSGGLDRAVNLGHQIGLKLRAAAAKTG